MTSFDNALKSDEGNSVYPPDLAKAIFELDIPDRIYLKTAMEFDDKYIVNKGNKWTFDYSGSRRYLVFNQDYISNKLNKYICFKYASTRFPTKLPALHLDWRNIISYCREHGGFSLSTLRLFIEKEDIDNATFYSVLFGLKILCAETFPGFNLEDYDDLEFVPRPYLEHWGVTGVKDLLIESLQQERDTSRFSLLTQIYIKLNDVMTLIALSGEELFYEMGIAVDIMESLKQATASDSLAPLQKFWALDGLVFSELKDGVSEQIAQWLEAMGALLTEHEFGYRERTAYTMKRMLFLSEKGDLSEVQTLAEDARPSLPDEEHARIFDYNHAIALWRLKRYKQAETLCLSVVNRYYALFGITPQDVMGKNSDVLWAIINQPENVHEHIKHLADALELLARINDAQGKVSPFLRIHAMKFYNMTAAPESLVRVGQDLADEFVAIKDYVGAREVMEQYVLPVVNEAGLVQRLVQVRSQYAVILALAGEHEQAEAEMCRLAPFFEGLTGEQRLEVENQSNYIAQLAYKAAKSEVTRLFGAVGRNEP